MQITETYYLTKCEVCGKEKKQRENPYSETFLCKDCKEKLPEPKLIDVDDFASFIGELQDWENKTEKKSSYNWNNITKDVFKFYGVSGEKAEKAWGIAYEINHSDGYPMVINLFEELTDLIK